MIKFRRFLLNKLIRDKMLDLGKGGKATLKTLDDQTAIQTFKLKLQEETAEVIQAVTIDDITEELADVLEVIHGFAHAMHLSFDDVETVRKDKKEKRGGFENQLFVEYVDLPEDHSYVAYNLSQPDKTPEIPYTDE